ncbi:glycosyltransferase family 4 protein [Haematomicrobium sanguinis]|uniref:glycosyltransferase family 4 protein n=1 Tax=Haematomicrobium sanguinis TaxID=479106 RepID=UPI00054FB0ED|nr:glycosyltransferase family 4 protein [Haematomicrobium sanguinis]
MHILQVHNYYRSEQPSGEDVVVDQERLLLEAAGHTVTQFDLHSDDIATFSTLRKALVPAKVVYSRSAGRVFDRLVERVRPDVVHVHNTFPLIGPAPIIRAKRRGLPVVATMHNHRQVCAAATLTREGSTCVKCVGGNPLPGLVHACYRGSRLATLPLTISTSVHTALRTWSRNVDTFIFMSRLAAGFFDTLDISEEQIRVKPHSVPEPQATRVGPGRYALYLGRLSQEKGAGPLIDAWPESAIPLVVVGDGPLREELERKAHGKNVEFRGKMPREEAMRVLSEARFVVNPSPALETFGMSVVEAISYGVPALAGDHAVPGEIITPGLTGATYRVSDGTGLEEAISLLSDETTSLKMGQAARAEYLAKYTPAANTAALEDIYRDALQRHGGAGR